jgi:hypothetical protein
MNLIFTVTFGNVTQIRALDCFCDVNMLCYMRNTPPCSVLLIPHNLHSGTLSRFVKAIIITGFQVSLFESRV